MTISLSRRTLLAGAALVAANAALGGATVALAGETTPLRPPTAQDEAHVHATCLKCGRCISACPQSCLRSGLVEDGVLNWRTPVVSFRRGLCDFCGRCADVCPTGTIRAMDPAADRIGTAAIDRDRCIAWSAGSSCLVCVDACPYGAVSTDASGRPVIDASLCNGCGACEHACPSNSYRAFVGGSRRGVNVEPASTDTPALALTVSAAPRAAGASVGEAAASSANVNTAAGTVAGGATSAEAAGNATAAQAVIREEA